MQAISDCRQKLLPISRPKNCEYHNTPAKAQNKRLFKTLFYKDIALTDKYSLPVLFLYFADTISRIRTEPAQSYQKITGSPAYNEPPHLPAPHLNRCSGIQAEGKTGTHHTASKATSNPLSTQIFHGSLFSSSPYSWSANCPATDNGNSRQSDANTNRGIRPSPCSKSFRQTKPGTGSKTGTGTQSDTLP